MLTLFRSPRVASSFALTLLLAATRLCSPDGESHLWADDAQPQAGKPGDAASATKNAAPEAVTALQTSLAANLEYAQQWLGRDDFASLRQTAGDLSILTDALDRQSDEPTWRATAAKLQKAVDALGRAASKKDKPAATAALAETQAAIQEVHWQGGAPHSLAAPPRGNGGRAMMHLVEAVLADAKTAAAVGDLPAAKDHARVLSLASQLLSNEHSDDEDWTKHARGMADDSLRAANAAGREDAKAFRQALADSARRCTDCHAAFR
ncbi:MAG TPA: hypothetical protein VGE52_20910 [Pirellulales bacterium]